MVGNVQDGYFSTEHKSIGLYMDVYHFFLGGTEYYIII